MVNQNCINGQTLIRCRRGRLRAAAGCDAAAGRVRRQGEAAADGGPAVGGRRSRRGPVLLPAERQEAGGGDAAPAQRLGRAHAPLVQQDQGSSHRYRRGPIIMTPWADSGPQARALTPLPCFEPRMFRLG